MNVISIGPSTPSSSRPTEAAIKCFHHFCQMHLPAFSHISHIKTAVPSDLAGPYHRSRIAQRIQPSLLRPLPTLLFSTAASKLWWTLPTAQSE
jgi:hypothetical protein